MHKLRVNVSDEVLSDLRTRLKLTRWADDFANEGWQYGTNTEYLKELVSYRIEGYDWRKQERAINSYLQFRTEIDTLLTSPRQGRFRSTTWVNALVRLCGAPDAIARIGVKRRSRR